ncbi:MAG TPA: hypothetical protein VH814_07755 [Steroidobacteraceae bacterium]|jgi:hypothetical protein
MRTVTVLLALAAASVVTAAENPPLGAQAQKTVAGFSGVLIVTPDEDWVTKWNTSPESIPYFHSGATLRKGGKLFVLTLYSNPQLDAAGAASVSMDIDVLRPDGSSSSHAAGAVCTQGKVTGPVESMYLCHQVVEFFDEPADPVGKWTVRIVLKDDVRKVSIPLTTEFKLAADGPIV